MIFNEDIFDLIWLSKKYFFYFASILRKYKKLPILTKHQTNNVII